MAQMVLFRAIQIGDDFYLQPCCCACRFIFSNADVAPNKRLVFAFEYIGVILTWPTSFPNENPTSNVNNNNIYMYREKKKTLGPTNQYLFHTLYAILLVTKLPILILLMEIDCLVQISGKYSGTQP